MIKRAPVSGLCTLLMLGAPLGLRAQVDYAERPEVFCEIPSPPDPPMSSDKASRDAYMRDADAYFDAVNSYYFCLTQAAQALKDFYSVLVERELEQIRREYADSLSGELRTLRESQ